MNRNESGLSSSRSQPPLTQPARRPQLTVGGRRVDIFVEGSPASDEQGKVDICFVFDTTGSMTDKLDGLINCMAEFVGHLSSLRLDWRVTAVPFGDLKLKHLGDRVVADLAFASTRDSAQQLLGNLPRFNGGGNGGESSLEAVQAACNKQYRGDAIKVLVVLTDEPPHETPGFNTGTVGKMIAKGEFICFVASPDPRLHSRVEGFKKWALENGGQWYPISQSMKTDKILRFLGSLVRDIPKVTDKALQAGSVRRLLELESNDTRQQTDG